MAHAAASIKKVREADLDEKEKNLERERKKQRKIPRERMERKRKVRGASLRLSLIPAGPSPPSLQHPPACTISQLPSSCLNLLHWEEIVPEPGSLPLLKFSRGRKEEETEVNASSSVFLPYGDSVSHPGVLFFSN